MTCTFLPLIIVAIAVVIGWFFGRCKVCKNKPIQG